MRIILFLSVLLYSSCTIGDLENDLFVENLAIQRLEGTYEGAFWSEEYNASVDGQVIIERVLDTKVELSFIVTSSDITQETELFKSTLHRKMVISDDIITEGSFLFASDSIMGEGRAFKVNDEANLVLEFLKSPSEILKDIAFTGSKPLDESWN